MPSPRTRSLNCVSRSSNSTLAPSQCRAAESAPDRDQVIDLCHPGRASSQTSTVNDLRVNRFVGQVTASAVVGALNIASDRCSMRFDKRTEPLVSNLQYLEKSERT